MATQIATGRFPTTTANPNPAAATAAAWVAAKAAEKAAAADVASAKSDRDTAAAELLTLLADGDSVTINRNTTYTLRVSAQERTVDSKVIAALRVLHPELNATIDKLRVDPVNRTAFTKIDLKRERI